MDRKEEIRKELEEISPFLSKMKKENPFEVPYGYFDKMQREVMQKVKEPEVVASPSLWEQLLGSWLQPRMAWGALSIALIAVAGFFLWPTEQSSTLAGVEGETVEWEAAANAYLAANIDEFDDELLAELVLTADPAEEILPKEEDLNDELIDEILNELDDIEIEDLL